MLTSGLGIDRYVNARRNETLALSDIMHGIKTTACTWASPMKTNSRASVTATALQRKLLEDCVVWLFEHFIVDLLKVNMRLPTCQLFITLKSNHSQTSISRNLPLTNVAPCTSYKETGKPFVRHWSTTWPIHYSAKLEGRKH